MALSCSENSDTFKIRSNSILNIISAETLENPELSMKLNVKLSASHPLSIPQVEIESSIISDAT